MKQKILFTLVLALLTTVLASAYDFEEGGIYYKRLSDTTVEVTYMKANYASPYAGSIVIPSTVTHDQVDYTVTRIGSSSFMQSFDLTSVVLPNTITAIDDAAFWDCASLKNVNIPSSVTRIGNEAFFDCISLTNLIIPASVTHIGWRALFGCGSSANKILVEGGNSNYDSRNDCNAVIETANNVLIVGCNHTVIPEEITQIADGAFWACSGLNDVILPDNVTIIGDLAFGVCSGLTSIDIPASVTFIGEEAFYNSTDLTSVVCRAVLPPGSYENTFSFDNGVSAYEQVTLFVPQEALEAYRSSAVWCNFVRIVPFLGTAPGDVNGDGKLSIVDVAVLINNLLIGDMPAYCDVNGDGMVTIADVTCLIDKIFYLDS